MAAALLELTPRLTCRTPSSRAEKAKAAPTSARPTPDWREDEATYMPPEVGLAGELAHGLAVDTHDADEALSDKGGDDHTVFALTQAFADDYERKGSFLGIAGRER